MTRTADRGPHRVSVLLGGHSRRRTPGIDLTEWDQSAWSRSWVSGCVLLRAEPLHGQRVSERGLAQESGPRIQSLLGQNQL